MQHLFQLIPTILNYNAFLVEEEPATIISSTSNCFIISLHSVNMTKLSEASLDDVALSTTFLEDTHVTYRTASGRTNK